MAGCSSSVNPQAKKYYNAGVDALSENNYNDAITSFTEALAIDPTYADAYLYRGDAYVMAAEETAKLAVADPLTVYSHLVNAKIDYKNALNNDEKLAASVSDKQLMVEELKPQLVSYKILPLVPSSTDPSVRTAKTSFSSTFEVAYSTTGGNRVKQPGTIQLTVTEAASQQTAREKLNELGGIDEELALWLDTHADYKEVSATMTVNTEWNWAYNHIRTFLYFLYMDTNTNLGIGTDNKASWVINTLKIDGQDTEILVISTKEDVYGESGVSFTGTIILTMLVPADYELGTFCIGTSYYPNETQEDDGLTPFESITELEYDLNIHFVEIAETN